MKADESLLPLIHWAVLLVVAVAYVWIDDAWLHRHGHEYLTTEVHEALVAGGWVGPLLASFMGAVVALGIYHFGFQAVGTSR